MVRKKKFFFCKEKKDTKFGHPNYHCQKIYVCFGHLFFLYRKKVSQPRLHFNMSWKLDTIWS